MMIALLTIFALSTLNNPIHVEKEQPIDYAYAMYDNFDTLDMNRDGKLTLQEVQNLIRIDDETFDSFDTDGDGQLTKEELQSAIKQLTTCGSQLRRGCSCAVNRVQTWISDFIIFLLSMTILTFLGTIKRKDI